jgi:DNA-binding winged helix-turn-helix (wHTH) protein
VDPALNRLFRGQQTVRLERKAMEVLVCLVDRAGEVVSKHELLDTVWRTEFVSDNTLQGRIAELRGTLGDDVRSPRFIETVRTRGYRLIAPVRTVETPGGAGKPARYWLIADGSSIPLNPGEIVIGRSYDADIAIRMPKVSRYHAKIVVDADRCVIEDLGSTNGTWVNDERVRAVRELVHGDRIRIGRGERTYQFACGDPDAETVPSAAAPSAVDPG